MRAAYGQTYGDLGICRAPETGFNGGMDVAMTAKDPLERWRILLAQRSQRRDVGGLGDLVEAERPPWDYEELVRHELGFAGSALDLGTGRGEFLSSLQDDFPVEMYATVRCPQDLPFARGALEPLGVEIRAHDALRGGPLPFPDACVDVVLSRHEPFVATEVARVLRPGGWLVAQLLGEHHLEDLAEIFGGDPAAPAVSLSTLCCEIEQAGLVVERAEAWRGRLRFESVDALVGALPRLPWQLPESFDIGRHADTLLELDASEDPLELADRRCLLIACKPEPEQMPGDPFRHW